MYTVGEETVQRNRITKVFFKYCQLLKVARSGSLTDHKLKFMGNSKFSHWGAFNMEANGTE